MRIADCGWHCRVGSAFLPVACTLKGGDTSCEGNVYALELFALESVPGDFRPQAHAEEHCQDGGGTHAPNWRLPLTGDSRDGEWTCRLDVRFRGRPATEPACVMSLADL